MLIVTHNPSYNTNKEQLTVIMKWVDGNLDVFEEFFGMYNLQSTPAESIGTAIMDVLLQFQIPISKIRGEYYDGCSTMAGARGGEVAKIYEMEPPAVFTHCYGHVLYLSVSDTIKQCIIMKDCLDTSYELVKLIKYSPKFDALLSRLKEEFGSDSS